MEYIQKEAEEKSWIDMLRATAIFLIIYGSFVPIRTQYFSYVFPIAVSAIFATSGYLLVHKLHSSVSSFFKHLMGRLVLPWLIIGLAPAFFWASPEGTTSIWQRLIILLTDDTYWLIPTLIFGKSIFFLVHKGIVRHRKGLKKDKNATSKDNTLTTHRLVGFASIILSLIGLALCRMDLLYFTIISKALASQIFFLMGYQFYRHQHDIILKFMKSNAITGFYVLYIVLCYIGTQLFPGSRIDWFEGNIYQIIPASVGLLATLRLFYKIKGNHNIAKVISRNIIFISLWCTPLTFLYFHITDNDINQSSFYIVSALFLTLGTIIVSVLLALFIKYISNGVSSIIHGIQLQYDTYLISHHRHYHHHYHSSEHHHHHYGNDEGNNNHHHHHHHHHTTNDSQQ
ncbi:MAG: hypothetical protein KBT06_07490 [Prevotellaceae bacterium]|nr:hypothetical protein [Candidatus Colivivens equi]